MVDAQVDGWGKTTTKIDDATKALSKFTNIQSDFAQKESERIFGGEIGPIFTKKISPFANGIDELDEESFGDEDFYQSIKEKFEPALDATKEFTDELNAMFTSMLSDSFASLFEGIGQAFVDGNMDEVFKTILSSFGSFLSQMGKMIFAYGVSMEAFKKAFTNPIAAIIAGASLMALGGAIKALSTKSPMSNSSGGSAPSGGSSFWTPQSQPQLVARVSGRDLEFVLNENSKLSNRVNY
jgi:hypothetical protein